MADYRGGGLTNVKIREAEKLVENIRHNVEQKKKEAEGAVSKSKLGFRSSSKIKWAACSRWSVGPNPVWGIIVTTIIAKMHPSLGRRKSFFECSLYHKDYIFIICNFYNVSVIWFHFLLFNDTLIGCIFVLPVYFTRVFFLVQF